MAATLINLLLDKDLSLYDFKRRHAVEKAMTAKQTAGFFQAAAKDPTDLLLMFHTNPLFTFPSNTYLKEIFRRKDLFKISFSNFVITSCSIHYTKLYEECGFFLGPGNGKPEIGINIHPQGHGGIGLKNSFYLRVIHLSFPITMHPHYFPGSLGPDRRRQLPWAQVPCLRPGRKAVGKGCPPGYWGYRFQSGRPVSGQAPLVCPRPFPPYTKARTTPATAGEGRKG